MTEGTPATWLGGDLQIASRFLLEVDGIEIGVFQEVSGLELNVEVVEIVEGGENQFVHKKPGRITWPNIVFKRGITDDDALFEWVQKSSGDGFAEEGNIHSTTTGAVTVIGSDGSRLRKWNLVDVWPVKWSGPTFNIQNEEVLSETLELAHHGFSSSQS